MDSSERLAIAAFANEMSQAFSRLSAALAGEPAPAFTTSMTAVSWQERVLRQSLILHEIKARGGSVPQSIWYEIAARHGYSGRGLAGFFRSNAQGLLELRGNKVYITKRGKERLAQNQERVDNALEIAASASNAQ